MAKAAGHILKGSNVKLEGPFHLNTEEVAPGSAKGKDVASATPQVSIVENQPEFAVIEITCSCGTKTYVRCEYAAAESPAEGPQMQNGASEDLDQKSDQKIEGPQMPADAVPDDAQNGASEDLNQKPDQTKITGENENAN